MKPLSLLFLLSCVLAASAQPAVPSAINTSMSGHPNFILILADDMGYADIGPFGSTKNRTPNLDRMAKEGMRLTSFYAAPVCTPSRAQILTGSYAKRVSLPNVIFPAAPVGLNTNEHTIAKLLKAQNYATMAIGKWHLGDHPDVLPTRHGFDHYFGLPYSNDMGRREAAARPGPAGNQKDRRPPLPLIRDGQVIETVNAAGQNSLTARYTDEAIRFIRTHQTEPFFLYMPHTAVHVPLHPGEPFKGKSSNGTYGDWVEELDWSVGQVMNTVRELGLSERTLVIFTSDNGPWLTQGTNGGTAGPLRGGKGGTFEGGVRVPTVAWWPGKVPAGSSCNAMAANYDFLPTFVTLTGGKLPRDNKIDGLDISPLLLGKTKDSPHEAHYYFSGNQLQAVRSGPWKLAIARQSEHMGNPAATAPAKAFEPTLYNLDEDIGETNNVIAKNPDVADKLRKLVAQMDADLGSNQAGPGVRQPCRPVSPKGLWLPGQEPTAAEIAAHYDTPALDKLVIGDALAPDEAPQIANKSLVISARVEPKTTTGVIVAQGGITFGYAVYLKDGKPSFTVREKSQPVTITGSDALPGSFSFEARLAADGKMSLLVDGKTVATGKSPLISRQPQEDFCLGHDNKNTVGNYNGKKPFEGKISELKITVE